MTDRVAQRARIRSLLDQSGITNSRYESSAVIGSASMTGLGLISPNGRPLVSGTQEIITSLAGVGGFRIDIGTTRDLGALVRDGGGAAVSANGPSLPVSFTEDLRDRIFAVAFSYDGTNLLLDINGGAMTASAVAGTPGFTAGSELCWLQRDSTSVETINFDVLAYLHTDSEVLDAGDLTLLTSRALNCAEQGRYFSLSPGTAEHYFDARDAVLPGSEPRPSFSDRIGALTMTKFGGLHSVCAPARRAV